MTDMNARLQRVIGQLSGNESLLEMLEAEAATEMLNWGTEMATGLVQKTEGMDDAAADLFLEPRLKAVRQTMRSVGNWATGKYTDPESRLQLRLKLSEYFNTIFEGRSSLLPGPSVDSWLDQVDEKNKTPIELIQNFKSVVK